MVKSIDMRGTWTDELFSKWFFKQNLIFALSLTLSSRPILDFQSNEFQLVLASSKSKEAEISQGVIWSLSLKQVIYIYVKVHYV